jgi:hypothetical protein
MSADMSHPSNTRVPTLHWLRRGRRSTLSLIAVQVGLLGAMAAWMRVEEATQPRGWAPTAPVDPELPIRGRYVSLVLRLPAPTMAPRDGMASQGGGERVARVVLRVRDGRVTAVTARAGDSNPQNAWRRDGTPDPAAADPEPAVDLEPPLAFFLPEHSADPSRRPPGERLWAEVVLPRWGPPRPLRLGVERQPGRIEPLPSR